MNKLLLKKYNIYHYEKNKFNIRIFGNKTINFSKKYKYVGMDNIRENIIWSDKIKEFTNNKLKSKDIIPEELYPKIYNLDELYDFSDDIKFYVKPIEGSNGKNINILKKKEILKNKTKFKDYFIQQYLVPKTINDRKYDIRIYYFVIKQKNIISSFVSLNGKIRLCNEKFKNGNFKSEIANSSQLSENDNLNELQGSLLNLLPLEREQIFKTIKKLDYCLKKHFKNIKDDFVNLYGIDLLTDKDNKTWIIELNGNPNWQIKQDSDNLKEIKTNTFDEILKILTNFFYKKNYHIENWEKLN